MYLKQYFVLDKLWLHHLLVKYKAVDKAARGGGVANKGMDWVDFLMKLI